MRSRVLIALIVASCPGLWLTGGAAAQTSLFHKFWGHSGPPTLRDVAVMIDRIQEQILDQGTVVVKQPDVWSQARMTRFRQEYEDTMGPELTKFSVMMNARIARSDTSTFRSETALGAALSPATAKALAPLDSTDALTKERTETIGLIVKDGVQKGMDKADAPTTDFALLNNVSLQTEASKKAGTIGGFGLEPTVALDQQSNYITHLHRLRRVNLGDDNADAAGYGLYLMRVPVSIWPGDKTNRGFGAEVNLTVRHDFGPRFLPATYRNLVINDLIDQLAPVVHEAIRSGVAQRFQTLTHEIQNERRNDQKNMKLQTDVGVYQGLAQEFDYVRNQKAMAASTNDAARLATVNKLEARIAVAAGTLSRDANFLSDSLPTNRSGQRTYSVAPSDVPRVFIRENLMFLAFAAQRAVGLGLPRDAIEAGNYFMDVNKVRMIDVRNFLRHELEAAYDLMEGRSRQSPPVLRDEGYIDDLTEKVYSRAFEGAKDVEPDSLEELNEFATLYESLTQRLPGNLRFRPVGALCWAIAVQAGLLNRQLIEDMKQVRGADGYTPPADVDAMHFYTPEPTPDAELVFQEYVKARWPMITFALEPVVDQQNIEDAFTRRRDLQLAVAFALSSGRISFRQAINFTRQLQYEAQTIALNQTVAAFAHGNDNFGWRFMPRYQTPPEESNLRAVTNMLLRGGPGPNYQLAHSKIEPGIRELTAVVVMPSFVRGVRIDVASNWFRLHDPDERKVHSARSVELGRRIVEARQLLEVACQNGEYRPDDVERLRVRLKQIEAMLPLQTSFVRMPYENTLGGFALFTQGATALVPQLSGFENVDYLKEGQSYDVVIYGKNFNIYETEVMVGGRAVPREGARLVVDQDTAGKPITVLNTLAGLRNKDGKFVVKTSTGQTIEVEDQGSYKILSREVMRLRIPPVRYTSRRRPAIDGREDYKDLSRRPQECAEVVEVYVSTPNGISNRLLIPVAPSKDDCNANGALPAFAPAPAPAMIARRQAGVGAGVDPDELPPLPPPAAPAVAPRPASTRPRLESTSGDGRAPLPRPAQEPEAVTTTYQPPVPAPPTPTDPAPAPAPAPTPAPAAPRGPQNQVLMMLPQSAPNISISVPVTNVPKPRHPWAERQRPARPPLLNRLIYGP